MKFLVEVKLDAKPWLPEFCRLPTLFAVMVVAELVALVVMLTSYDEVRPFWARLGTLSLFVQWLALLCAGALCSLRSFLTRATPFVGMTVAWALAVMLTLLGSILVYSLDHELQLGLTVLQGQGFRFALGNAALCALITAALLRYFFVLEQWKDGVRAAAKAQVEALQARIRPHFLFNSMNTMASLVRSQPVVAERMIEDLADLFRAAFHTETSMGSLGEELDLVQNYVRIEQLRLGERLKVEMQLDALPRDFLLPRLLLQPLIENAVYHGIQTLPEGGTVSVKGYREDKALRIEVQNPLGHEVSPTRNAHALGNVRSRLAYHFGDRGQLLIQSQSNQFLVTLRLPLG